jgi:23S rRNA pseudouridine955/2504/2580 synthase
MASNIPETGIIRRVLEFQQKKPAVRNVLIEQGHEGQRIDNFLIGLLKGVPRSYVYRIVRRGEVRVNKGRIQASYRLQAGDLVRVPPVRVAERVHATPDSRLLQRLEQAILYEDSQLLVLNKPSGIAVHGGSGLSYGLIEAFRAMRPDERYLELVHRLDRETSGCLLIAKRRSMLRHLHEMLRSTGVDKRYLALLAGTWQQERVEVKAALQKNTLRGGERVVRVDPGGKEAATRFRVRERFQGSMLVEARPVTGRTHQIRVHAAHLGTPILGDEKYGDDAANQAFRAKGLRRLFLHAESLRFRLPDEKRELKVHAPLEQRLESLLAGLRR